MLQFIKKGETSMIQYFKKIIMLSILLLMLTGCSIEYTITIDEATIQENIAVLDNVSDTRTVTDIMNNYKYKYYVYDKVDSEDYEPTENYEEGLLYYTQSYNIDSEGYHLYYDYTHPIANYMNAVSVVSSYNTKHITYSNNKLSIKTTSPNSYLRYSDLLDNLTVSIITDYNVISNNADSVDGNKYTWTFDKDNNYTKQISFEVDLSKKTNEEEDKNSSNENDTTFEEKKNTIIVVIVFAIYLIITIIFIIRKRKKA